MDLQPELQRAADWGTSASEAIVSPGVLLAAWSGAPAHRLTPRWKAAPPAATAPGRRGAGPPRFDRLSLPENADDVSWPSQCERLARFNQ